MNKPNAGAKPHVHAEVIKAWADGAEIEVRVFGNWEKVTNPCWADWNEYRIKPSATHKIGNRYTYEGSEYILAQHGPCEVVLISIRGFDVGNRWSESVRVETAYKISQEEFNRVCSFQYGFELITE